MMKWLIIGAVAVGLIIAVVLLMRAKDRPKKDEETLGAYLMRIGKTGPDATPTVQAPDTNSNQAS